MKVHKLFATQLREKPWKESTTFEKISIIVYTLGRISMLAISCYIFICCVYLLAKVCKVLGIYGYGDLIIHSKWVQNDLAASVIGILLTIILQSNNAVVCILISMVAGNLITLHQANFITLGSQIGITVVNAFHSLSLRKRDYFFIYYAVGIMSDVTSFLCYIVILPAEVYASPIESFAKYILERWRNTCPKLTTLTAITQPFIDVMIQIDESIILPTNDSYIFHEPTQFVILRCINPQTSELIFCSHTHIFRYSRLSDKTIVLIVGSATLITVILSEMTMGIMVHSLCDGFFSEKFMILVNKIVCFEIIWFFDWIIDAIMIGIGFILFPIIEPHSLFSPKLNPYAKLDPTKADRLFPMLLGGNIGQSLGGIVAAFAIPASSLYNGLRIALDQTVYNIFCLVLFYPIPIIRRIPVKLSLKFGKKTAKYRWFAFVYVGVVSLIILSVTLFTSFFPDAATYTYVALASTSVLVVIIVTLIQRSFPHWLPDMLKTWHFLPLWMRSLRPYNSLLRKMCTYCCCAKYFNHPNNNHQSII